MNRFINTNIRQTGTAAAAVLIAACVIIISAEGFDGNWRYHFQNQFLTWAEEM